MEKIYEGDAIAVLKQWPDGFVHTICTSPPYWGLRDYGVAGQYGLERTIDEWVARMVEVFREARRVLRADGTFWLNLGDSHLALPSGSYGTHWQIGREKPPRPDRSFVRRYGLLKKKDLIGQPWRLALALQADGWYLRSDIIWHKPNAMPESASDRPTRAHEYIFLLSKSPRYFYDADAIMEPVSGNAHSRGNGVNPKCAGWAEGPGSHKAVDHAKAKKDAGREELGLRDSTKFGRGAGWRNRQNASFSAACSGPVLRRNKRTVWTVPTQPCREAHFATFPQKLIVPCILAGAPSGGIVLDPFMGSGTTALVSLRLKRRFLGCELNPDYIKIAERRIAAETAQGRLL